MSNILTIFDFDETLITSETEIIIQHADGNITYMNSEDYASYVPKPGDKFDYSNFDKYPKDARKIKLTFTELESALSRGDHVMILTARANRAPVEEFMKNHGYDVEVVTVGSSNPQAKARVVMDRVMSTNYDLVQVFEDNATNIRAIKKVVTDAGVRFRSTKISASHRTQLMERFLRKKSMTKRYPIGAGMVVVRDFDQIGRKVLVLKCLDGSWDLPKGSLDPGESLYECALRETREEASITDMEFPWQNSHCKLDNLTFYMCLTQQDPIIKPNPAHGYCEHESAWWVDPDDAFMLVPDYLKPAVKWAIDILYQ